MADLKLMLEELKATLAQPPKGVPNQNLPEGCRKQKMADEACGDDWWRQDKQDYKVTVSGEVVEPLWPTIGPSGMVCPPCETKLPAMHPSHSCYKPPGARSSPNHQLGSPKKKYTVPLGDGTCPGRYVCMPRPCPPQHKHWNPECTTCKYPNACKADCTSHPASNDWLYRQSPYRYYLQKRDYRPFMAGF